MRKVKGRRYSVWRMAPFDQGAARRRLRIVQPRAVKQRQVETPQNMEYW